MINAYPIADPHVRDSIPETRPHQVGPTTTPKMTTSTHDKPVDSWDTPDAMLQNKIINAWVSMRETPSLFSSETRQGCADAEQKKLAIKSLGPLKRNSARLVKSIQNERKPGFVS